MLTLARKYPHSSDDYLHSQLPPLHRPLSSSQPAYSHCLPPVHLHNVLQGKLHLPDRMIPRTTNISMETLVSCTNCAFQPYSHAHASPTSLPFSAHRERERERERERPALLFLQKLTHEHESYFLIRHSATFFSSSSHHHLFFDQFLPFNHSHCCLCL